MIRVVDGDTVWLDVSLGFDVKRKDSFRLAGINAPEMSTEAGPAAKEWLVARLAEGALIITTKKDKRERYGRYLATLWINDVNVNEAMVEAGHAVPYMA